MQRRQLLRHALLAPALLGAGRLWAAADPQLPRFLLVFLRGGYDAMSLLVPAGSSFYREVRPAIAIAEPLPLTSEWGLHPALKDNLLGRVQAGQCRFVPFAGTHDSSRSHFETQDAIELGQEAGTGRDYASGFLNRLAQALGAPRSIAFSDRVPVAWRGPMAVPNVPLRQLTRAAGGAAMQPALSELYAGTPLAPRVQEGFAVRQEVAQAMDGMDRAQADPAGNRGAVSARGFEAEARRMARLMRDGYTLGFVDVGGWDTHVAQGADQGTLATRLQELGRGLSAFADEIGEPTWRRTVVVVLSEFGRTARENGNRGTDHGHGSVHWVLGGGLATGAPVVGAQVPVQASTLFQDRDWPVLNEYRSVLAGLWSRQYGLTPQALQGVFPGVRAQDLALV